MAAAKKKQGNKANGSARGPARGKKASPPVTEHDDDDDDGVAPVGHNLKITKSGAAGFAKRYNNLLDDKESRDGEIMASVKDLIEEGAQKLGCPRKVLRIALKEQRAEMKREAREKEMEPDTLDALDKLRDALGLFSDTPLGAAAVAAAGSEASA